MSGFRRSAQPRPERGLVKVSSWRKGQRLEIVQRVARYRDIRSTLGYAELQETQVRAGPFEPGTMTIAACKRIPDSRRWPS
jgi:hypothetical protein